MKFWKKNLGDRNFFSSVVLLGCGLVTDNFILDEIEV